MIVSNNKGITLIALVITIVVLLILASIGIGGAITGVDESTDQKLKSELDTYIVNYKTGEVYNETQKTTNDGNILYICAVE